MAQRGVVVHKERGVFLGSSLWLDVYAKDTDWDDSKNSVPTFSDAAEAAAVIERQCRFGLHCYRFDMAEVAAEDGRATLQEIADAGLKDDLGALVMFLESETSAAPAP